MRESINLDSRGLFDTRATRSKLILPQPETQRGMRCCGISAPMANGKGRPSVVSNLSLNLCVFVWVCACSLRSEWGVRPPELDL